MNKFKHGILLIGVLVLGLLLRLYHNTDISLWHDEAFSALLIKYPWGEMFYRIGLDVHPPAYYVALRLWHYVFGDALLSLRGFSVFFGLATAVAGYGFVKEAFKSRKAALIAALLIAVNPFQLQYATEARMYTFGAFLAVLAAYFLVKMLNGENSKQKIVSSVAFGITGGLAALTHYYLLFTVAALCFYGLAWHVYHYKFMVKRYAYLLGTYVLIALTFAPWIKWFLYQYKQVGAGYWIPPLDRWSIPTTIWQILMGIGVDISHTQTKILVSIATLFTVFVMTMFVRKYKATHGWLVVLAFLAPFGGALLFAVLARLKGETSSVYLVRYFLYASTFYTIALAGWLVSLKRVWLGYALLAIYVVTNLGAFWQYWDELKVQEKPGMAAAVKHLSTHMSPADKLYVGTSFEFFNLKYYLSQVTPPTGTITPLTMSSSRFSLEDLTESQGIPGGTRTMQAWPRPLLFTGGTTRAHDISHFAGSAILTDEDLLPRFEDGVQPSQNVWLVWTNAFGSNKPQTPQNWKQVDEAGFAEVRPYVGTWIVVTHFVVE